MKKNTAIKSRNAKILEHSKKNPHAPKELEATERIPELRVLNLPIPELLPKDNLWGEVFQGVHDKHPAGFEVGMQSSCSNPDCTKHPEAISEMKNINLGYYLNHGNDLNGIEDMERMTRAFEQPLQGMQSRNHHSKGLLCIQQPLGSVL